MASEQPKQPEPTQAAKSLLAKIVQAVAYVAGISIILLVLWSIIYSLWAIFRDMT